MLVASHSGEHGLSPSLLPMHCALLSLELNRLGLILLKAGIGIF